MPICSPGSQFDKFLETSCPDGAFLDLTAKSTPGFVVLTIATKVAV